MPTPSASDALNVDPAFVARFAEDLTKLIDVARDRVVVALSGGTDSVALLMLMHATLGDRCSAATVDHGLRAAAADEAQMAANLCAERGIAHRTLTGPLPDRSGRTANLSARARTLRYDLLLSHVADIGAGWLATAHHADDQLETTLMRLNRGAGVAGLAGIRARGWRVVRPLLGWRRHDLAQIVSNAGVTAMHDPSNDDDRFDRARLRKAVASVDWLDAAGFSTSAAALADAEEALTWAAQELTAERAIESDEGIVVNPDGIPGELVRRLVATCLRRVDPSAAPDGPALTRAISSLNAGRQAMIGAVLIRPGRRWTFVTAPPRRTA